MEEKIQFRNLLADEIQVRPTDTKYKGSCTLLLYKDARVDMEVLDSSVGPMNWSREFYEVKGNVYCRIGIRNPENGEWVYKSDCGTESNVDAQKGEASDAAKRAAVVWGIGRELYTGPKVKIKCPDSYYYNDRLTMTFYVRNIGYTDNRITTLVIADKFDNVVFDWRLNGTDDYSKPENRAEEKKESIHSSAADQLTAFCASKKNEDGTDLKELKAFYDFYLKKCPEWNGNFIGEKLFERWMAKKRS